MRFQRYANRAILIPNNSNIVEIIRRDCYYLRRITHLNNLCALNCRPMQLASCFIPRTNSLKCVVQLCRNGFFCATYAFVRSFVSFRSFFYFYFIFPLLPLPPPSPCDECPWADRETQSRCLRKIFFFPGREKHQVPIFETSKSSIESMFKARCRRTNDRVISDR